jgi:hypothetical protein
VAVGLQTRVVLSLGGHDFSRAEKIQEPSGLQPLRQGFRYFSAGAHRSRLPRPCRGPGRGLVPPLPPTVIQYFPGGSCLPGVVRKR